jgi:hypothetical protein
MGSPVRFLNNKNESSVEHFSITASAFFLTRRKPIHGGSLQRVLRCTVRKKADAVIEKYVSFVGFLLFKNSLPVSYSIFNCYHSLLIFLLDNTEF